MEVSTQPPAAADAAGVASATTVSGRVTERLPLRKLPNPDYAHHPAYGLLFGRPKLSTRIRALRRLWPSLREQIVMVGQHKRRPRPAFETGAEGEVLCERVLRDGAVAVRLNADDLAVLREHMQPLIARLRQRKAAIPREKRVFKDMIMPVSAETAPAFIEYLGATLERHGVLAAASRYLGSSIVMRDAVKLQLTDADDAPWRGHFADVGLRDPETTYMHIDSEPRFLKCMLYLNEVTLQNGPFAYVIGSNNLDVGRIEYIVRKANDRSRLDKCDVATRQLFAALPRWFQMKSEFGNDLLDASPDAAALIAHEHPFTSEDGDLILFDNNGIHRGRKVIQGERHAVQIQLRSSAGAHGPGGGM